MYKITNTLNVCVKHMFIHLIHSFKFKFQELKLIDLYVYVTSIVSE